MRFSVIVALASVAVLTACNKSSLPSTAACAANAHRTLSAVSQNASAVLQLATATSQPVTAVQLGLWPRRGPSVRVCGDVGKGFARCQAWLRTDVQGEIKPGTVGGYTPSDLQTAYGLTSDSKQDRKSVV